jgi:hypothetical protein
VRGSCHAVVEINAGKLAEPTASCANAKVTLLQVALPS